MHRRARVRLVVGLALGAVALGADLVRGQPLELGSTQIALLGLGLGLVLPSLTRRWPRLRRATIAGIAMGLVTYGTLLGLELGLGLLAPPQATRNPLPGLRGMTIQDPAVGFRLAPDFRGQYDDGVARVEYRINARGDRDDDEPVAGATRRVLLLGDSFTFGQALPRSETIEARLEARSHGAIDAYDMGVPGYSAVHALRRFEQSPWWRGDDVIYLFFNNDVHPGSHRLDTMRVVFGYAVPRRGPDGTPYDEDELWQRLLQALRSDGASASARLGARLGLTRLRAMASAAHDRELRLTGLPADALDLAVVEQVVDHVRNMAARARERGATFHLVIIPTPQEAAEHAWSDGTGAFILAARAAGLEPDPRLLERLQPGDYLAHDGHFAASGADQTAALLLLRLGLHPA